MARRQPILETRIQRSSWVPLGLANILIAPTAGSDWERSGRLGRIGLHTLAFAATVVTLTAVGWTSSEFPFFVFLIAAAGLGHVVSSLPRVGRVRLGFVIYPASFLAIWATGGDLLTILAGGSLYPLTKLLTIVQTLASFNLRSLRSLYDSLLLNLTIILLASEGALSIHFASFLLAFGVVALFFLAVAYSVGEGQNLRWVGSTRIPGLVIPMIAIVVLTLGASTVVFAAVPQSYRVLDARPLPSRLDLTVGRPVSPLDNLTGDPAPSSGFLPSRGDDSGGTDQGSVLDGSTGQDGSDQVSGGASGVGSGNGAASGVASGDGAASGVASGDGAASGVASGDGAAPPAAQEPTGSAGGSGPIFELPGYATLGYQGDQGRDVVMYVRSRLVSYWRGQILDEYDGRGWKSSGDSEELMIDDNGRLRFSDFPWWGSLVDQYVQTFYPQVAQPNAVFTGYSPGYLAFHDSVEDGRSGRLLDENIERLHRATSYRVISAVPLLTPEVLRNDSASRERRLALPTVPVRVWALARAIVEGAPSDYDKAARLEKYLLNNYDYDLRVPAFSRSGDVVEDFLFTRKAGYCSQFATTMAVMARLVGLPARVVTGYVPGQFNGLTGAHTVRLQDAHAWVEIKFRKYGWVPFDPTPRPDSPWALDFGYAGAARGTQQVLRTQIREFVVSGSVSARDAVTTLLDDREQAWTYGAPPVAAVLLALGLIKVTRRRARTHRPRSQGYTLLGGAGRQEVRKAYQKALRRLRSKGYPQRRPDQSPEDYTATLREMDLSLPEPFQQISRQATQALYDPTPLDLKGVRELKKSVNSLRAVPNLKTGPKSRAHRRLNMKSRHQSRARTR